VIAGERREVVVVFSPKLQEGQLRGLAQSMLRSYRELQEMGLRFRTSLDCPALCKRYRHEELNFIVRFSY
jgi:hypothetical protein